VKARYVGIIWGILRTVSGAGDLVVAAREPASGRGAYFSGRECRFSDRKKSPSLVYANRVVVHKEQVLPEARKLDESPKKNAC
jgi:hypothetical protein